MRAKISLITLGVTDLKRASEFYRRLGFVGDESNPGVVFFKLENLTLALFPRKELARDAGMNETGSGFRGITLAHNVASAEAVDEVLKEAEAAGGAIVKPGQKVFWGGYAGYFADRDGFLWEVAWNPFMEL